MAFTLARAKLNPQALVRLNQVAVKTFYDQAEYYFAPEKRPQKTGRLSTHIQHNNLPQSDQKRRHSQKINRTNALSMPQDIMIGVFMKKKFTEAIEAFDKIVVKTREIIRPDRSFPRKKIPKRPYHMNYKRL